MKRVEEEDEEAKQHEDRHVFKEQKVELMGSRLRWHMGILPGFWKRSSFGACHTSMEKSWG